MRRALIVLAAVIVAIPLAGVAAASWFLNGDGVKARLVEQVRRATGREMTIAGPVRLAWSLSPTIELSDVSLANPPGFAVLHMAHAARIAARIGLLPLLGRRVAVERLDVAAPAIRLERDGEGRPNWLFARPAAPPSVTPAAPSTPSAPWAVTIGTVEITDANVTAVGRTLAAPRLSYDPATTRLSGTVAAAGTSFDLSGTADPAALDVRLAAPGLRATVTGAPAAATLRVQADSLAALSPLAGRPLPDWRDVVLTAGLPGPLRLEAGAFALGRLALAHATLTAPALDAPATLAATGTLGTLPLTLAGQLASPAALVRGPAPVDLRATGPGLEISAAGTLDPAGHGTLRLALRSPDLAAAGAASGLALPTFHAIDAAAELGLAPGTATLRALRLASAEGDLTGDLVLDHAARPILHGTLASTALDLRALFPAPAPAATHAPAPPSVATPAPPPATPARLIPDIPLPLAELRAADADLILSAATLRTGVGTLGAVEAHAALAGGTLRLDPLAATFGTAPARATLVLAAEPPALRVTVDAPGLPLGPVLAAAGNDPAAPGTLDLRADLSGTGATLRAVLATLTGHASLAVADGQIDNTLLERLAAPALHAAGVSFEAGGHTALRCFALAADAASGHVTLPTLALDTAKLSLDGSGAVDLGTEALDLRLRPQLRLGGGLSVPIRLRGTLAAPKAALDPGALASGRVGFLLGGPPPPDACGPALAAIRDGGSPAPRAARPADLLRGLLR